MASKPKISAERPGDFCPGEVHGNGSVLPLSKKKPCDEGADVAVQSVQQIVGEQKSPRLHVQLNCCRCGCPLVHQIVFYCKVKDTMSKKDPQLSPSTPWWCIWSSLESGVMGSVSRVKIVG